MHTVDPLPRTIGKRGEDLLGCQNLRFEAPHLTGGSGLPFDGFTTDEPPHNRVEAKSVSIVHVVLFAKASENGRAKLPDKIVATILP